MWESHPAPSLLLLGALPAGPGRAWLARWCVLERANADPSVWRDPIVHRAVLVSGLSVLMGSMVRLRADLPGKASAD